MAGHDILVRGDAEREIGEDLRSSRTRGGTLCAYVTLYNPAQLAPAQRDSERPERKHAAGDHRDQHQQPAGPKSTLGHARHPGSLTSS